MGSLIVLEGIEGCGKSTQAKMMASWLESQGNKVHLTKAPGGTTIGKTIREFILHSGEEINSHAELLLMKADEAQLVHEIKKKLDEDYIVICDRFACYSSIAYQGYGRGIDLDLIYSLNEISTQGLEPDYLFIIDVDNVEKCLERSKKSSGRYDRFESLPKDFHLKVQEAYRTMHYSYSHLIDGNGTVNEIFEKIKKIWKAENE